MDALTPTDLPLPDLARQLAQRLLDGKLALFVGAGLSHLARPAAGGDNRLPLWDELTKRVAALCHEPTAGLPTNPLDLFDLIVYQQERATLERAVRQVLDDRPFKPSAAHRALAGLPWNAIVTTNYDGLLARVIPSAPVANENGYDRLGEDATPQLFHLHGTLADPHTLTREDYRLWADSHPRAYRHLENLVLQGTVLFAGYSLSDPHLDALLATVRAITKGREKRLYAWMWRCPTPMRQLLDRRDKIEVVSIDEESGWAAAFAQIHAALADLRSAAPTSAVAIPAEAFAYERGQYVQALTARYGPANLQGLFVWSSGYARGDVMLDEIFVEPDLETTADLPEVLQSDEPQRARTLSWRQKQREPAATLLRRESHLVIVGAPGQGKTTLLRKYLLDAAARWREEPSVHPLPVYLRLSDWEDQAAAGTRRLLDHAVATLTESGEVGSDAARRWIDGPLLWLLDGVDEVREPFERERLREEVTSLARLRSADRWVVATRPAGEPTGGFAAGWRRAELPELAEWQMEEILKQWAVLIAKKEGVEIKASVLGRSLQRDPGLARLSGNALLLTLAVLFFKSRRRLPNDRWEFYEGAEQVLRDSWARYRLRRAQEMLPGGYLTEVLESLALHGMETGSVLFSEEQLAEECGKVLERKGYGGADRDRETALFLRAAEDLIGVLVAQGPRRFGFLHLTFQEYFTARALRHRSSEMVERIAQHWDDSDWTEVWPLYALAVQADETRYAQLLREILHHPRKIDERLERPRLMCLSLLGVGSPPPTSEGKDVVIWAAQVLDSGRNALRDQVLDRFARWEVDLPPLIRDAVWRLDGSDCLEGWFNVLRSLPRDASLRTTLFSILRNRSPDWVGWRRAADILVEAASDDAGLRTELLNMVPEMGTHQANSLLRSMTSLAEHDDCQIALTKYLRPQPFFQRWRLSQSLKKCAHKREVRPLLWAWLHSESEFLRAISAEASAPLVREPGFHSKLLDLLSDSSLEVQKGAVAAFWHCADEPLVQSRLRSLLNSDDLRLLVTSTLSQVDRDAALGWLYDASPFVGDGAARSLRRWARERGVRDTLLEVVRSGYRFSVDGASWALIDVLDDEIAESILKLLPRGEGPNYTDVQMFHSLIDRAPEQGVLMSLLVKLREIFLSALAGQDDLKQRLAAQALAPLAAEPDIHSALLDRLDDLDEDVRRTAFDALSASVPSGGRGTQHP